MSNLRTIQAICNYYENYNFEGDTPYYKIKGQHIFEFEIEFDELMYREEELKKCINDKIARWSNAHEPMSCRYIVREIVLKDEVTEFGVLTIDTYEKENLQPNKINPSLCSRNAVESIREIPNYREVCDFTNIIDKTMEPSPFNSIHENNLI